MLRCGGAGQNPPEPAKSARAACRSSGEAADQLTKSSRGPPPAWVPPPPVMASRPRDVASGRKERESLSQTRSGHILSQSSQAGPAVHQAVNCMYLPAPLYSHTENMDSFLEITELEDEHPQAARILEMASGLY